MHCREGRRCSRACVDIVYDDIITDNDIECICHSLCWCVGGSSLFMQPYRSLHAANICVNILGLYALSLNWIFIHECAMLSFCFWRDRFCRCIQHLTSCRPNCCIDAVLLSEGTCGVETCGALTHARVDRPLQEIKIWSIEWTNEHINHMNINVIKRFVCYKLTMKRIEVFVSIRLNKL